MALGRKGERVANTPMRALPPSRGGRTVGDQSFRTACENCQISQTCEKPSSRARALRRAELRLKHDLRPQRIHQPALARNAELLVKIAANARDDLHLYRLDHGRSPFLIPNQYTTHCPGCHVHAANGGLTSASGYRIIRKENNASIKETVPMNRFFTDKQGNPLLLTGLQAHNSSTGTDMLDKAIHAAEALRRQRAGNAHLLVRH